MKKVLLLTTIGVFVFCTYPFAQNVFDPNDLNRRWKDSTAFNNDPTRLTAHPNPNVNGLYKWVSVKTNGVDSANWGKDYKAYFLNLNGAKLAFRIKYPRSYSNPDSASKRYPSMLFFHGAGEPGCPSNGGVYNNEKQLVHGGKLFRDRVANNQYDGFLVYPQLVDNNCWSDWGNAPFSVNYNIVFAFIDSLVKYARLDVDRLQVFGLSSGGGAAWSATTAFPQKIAKSTPSSAATGATNYSNFVHVPIWFATGGQDTNPSPGYALSTYTNIKNAGGDIRYTRFDNLGHFAWNAHWGYPTAEPATDFPQNAGPYQSFVQYMNDIHKANPLIFFGRNAFCPDSVINARLGVTPGFHTYEWQKDGVLIATSVNGVNTILNPGVVTSFTGNEIIVKSFGTYRVRYKRTSSANFTIWSPKPANIVAKSLTNTPAIQINGLKSKVLPAPDGSSNIPLILPAGYLSYQWVRVSDNAVVSTTNTYNAPVGVYKAKVFEQFGCGSNFSPNFTVISASGTPKPDPASNLTVVANSNNTSMQLNWSQNPSAPENETGFEVYRRTVPSGPYQLIAIVGANVISYQDASPVLNTKNYYIVRAVGNSGAAANSNEASAGNNKPVIAGLAGFVVKAGATAQEDFTASDDPGDIVSVTIANMPGFVTLTPMGGTNYRITVNPTSNDLGIVNLKVVATDDKGSSASQTISIHVTDANTRTVFVNLGEGSRPAPLPWNNYTNNGQVNSIISNLKDESNVNTGFSMQLLDAWTGMFATGYHTGNNSGIVLDTVLRSGIFYNSTTTRRIAINGLDNLKLYNIAIVASQNEGYDASASYSLSMGSQTAVLNARYNSNLTGNLNAVSPAGGSITVNLTKLASATNMFINAIILEEYSPLTPMLSPSGLYIEPKDRFTTTLSWVDRTNNETGFELQRATDSLFSQGVATINLGANVTSYTNSGLSANTRYWYRVRARNGVNSGWSNRVRTITPLTMIFVNFNYSVTNAGSPWNNLQALPNEGFQLNNLRNQSGVGTGYNLRITRQFNGENNAGMNTGNNSAMGGLVPDNVIRSSYWMDKSQQCQMRITGLSAGRRYRVGLIASSNWVGGNLTTTLTINDRTVYVNAWKNTSKIAYIGDIAASSAGDMYLNFSTTSAAANGYASGVIIEDYNDVIGGNVLNTVTQNRLPVQEVVASQELNVSMYPNPFRDFVNVDFNNTSASNLINLQVYDIHGRLLVKRDYGRMAAGYNTLRFTAEGKLETGVYMLVLNINGQPVQTSKLIRTK